MRQIIDIGAHNGSDLAYFMSKAALVVAVEANPYLVEKIRSTYRREVNAGGLVVEHAAVTPFRFSSEIDLWVNKDNDVKSSLLKPSTPPRGALERIRVPTLSIGELLARHGVPDHLKIDVEGLDFALLRALRTQGLIPHSLSAEAHSIEVLGELSKMGAFTGYKIVLGRSVSRKYKNFSYLTGTGETRTISFPNHSSGPLGTDLPSGWFGYKDARAIFKLTGGGWVDVHAAQLKSSTDISVLGLRKRNLVSLLGLVTSLGVHHLPRRFRRIRNQLLRDLVN